MNGWLKQGALLLFVAVLVGGCATTHRLPPPPDKCAMADIPGIPHARFWGDSSPPDAERRVALMRRQQEDNPAYHQGDPVYILAISGGGQKGAFSAGLLNGWTASGTRPEFRIVTGVSTGALVAPFAFLGSGYDSAIRDIYTRFSTRDILRKSYIKGLIGGESMADNTPLREIVTHYFTPAEMKKIAQEFAQGRRLFVGTTHLDAQRPVIWDIGTIATSGDPGAYDLIVNILLASMAVPGEFPPAYFKVEQSGQTYEEMHVDGGVTSQIFVLPVAFRMEESMHQAGLRGQKQLYLIRNAKLVPEMEEVSPRTIPILSQSFFALMRAEGVADMYRIYLDAQLEHINYNAAYIPTSFRKAPSGTFDTDYMNELFSFAYEQAKTGYPWDTTPPDISRICPLSWRWERSRKAAPIVRANGLAAAKGGNRE